MTTWQTKPTQLMAFILRNNFNIYTGTIFVNYKNAHSYFHLNAVRSKHTKSTHN